MNPHHFEPDPSHIEPTIRMQKLCKVYDSGKVAVRNLSLDLFEGQILSFLGHNGAGKTTTMLVYIFLVNIDTRGILALT